MSAIASESNEISASFPSLPFSLVHSGDQSQFVCPPSRQRGSACTWGRVCQDAIVKTSLSTRKSLSLSPAAPNNPPGDPFSLCVPPGKPRDPPLDVRWLARPWGISNCRLVSVWFFHSLGLWYSGDRSQNAILRGWGPVLVRREGQDGAYFEPARIQHQRKDPKKIQGGSANGIAVHPEECLRGEGHMVGQCQGPGCSRFPRALESQTSMACLCRELVGLSHPYPHIIHVLSRVWEAGKLSHTLINISGVLKRFAVLLKC